MGKKLLALLVLFYVTNTYAETIKTDVLVIGSTPAGAATAIQCARSNVKTIFIMPGGWLPEMGAGVNYKIIANHNLPTGLWGEFEERVISFYKNTTGYEAAADVTLKFEASTGANILKGIADTVKNLTIKLNTPFTTIKKDGTGWDVTIKENGLTNVINAKVLIDATEKSDVVTKAGATLPRLIQSAEVYSGNMYRTAIAVSDILPAGFIPLQNVVVKDVDNLFAINHALPGNENMQSFPLKIALGQGVGVAAAFTAFFKTTTKHLRVRLVQQELLDFKGYLLPFNDINRDSRYIRAIQQIGATGMLKGEVVKGGLLFNPEAKVNTEEIKPVLTEIYSRAFLWFNKEKPGAQFTIGNLISLMSEMTLSEPQPLQNKMRADWSSKYHFTSKFDLNAPVTRLEFAVLVNQFLNPFGRTVDLEGNIVN